MCWFESSEYLSISLSLSLSLSFSFSLSLYISFSLSLYISLSLSIARRFPPKKNKQIRCKIPGPPLSMVSRCFKTSSPAKGASPSQSVASACLGLPCRPRSGSIEVLKLVYNICIYIYIIVIYIVYVCIYIYIYICIYHVCIVCICIIMYTHMHKTLVSCIYLSFVFPNCRTGLFILLFFNDAPQFRPLFLFLFRFQWVYILASDI